MSLLRSMVPLSLVDVPGHPAITLFTAGCNLRCPYCHNPDFVQGHPPDAPLSDAAVLAFLQRRRSVLSWVCITGGEPTLHPSLADHLHAIKSLGYQVKLDTNGSRPQVLERLIGDGLVNYVAMDIKTRWDSYRRVGAQEVAPFRASAAIIRAAAPDYEFRTTLVPGIVDGADLLVIAETLAGSCRYALQQFRPTDHLLNPAWSKISPFSDELVMTWAQAIHAFYGEVLVRNLRLSPAPDS